MKRFAVRYISGPQQKLVISDERVLEAETIDDALRQVSAWPIERSWSETSAWAKNPGTSLYHVEAWEASQLLDD